MSDTVSAEIGRYSYDVVVVGAGGSGCARRSRRGRAVSAPGGSVYNPGWHLALDLRNMLLIADCVAQAALERQESRGGHTRDDYPGMSPEWRKINLICSADADGGVSLTRQPNPSTRTDLLELFDTSELKKYMTEEELAGLPGTDGPGAGAAEENPSEASAPPSGAPPARRTARKAEE